MDIDPRRLRVLRAVDLAGGVVAAARLLHLTPSAVSQQLTQLEHEVGLPVLDRSRRQVGLTVAGRVLSASAERIEVELVQARRELTALSGRVRGPVVVAAFTTAIRHLVVPALRRLEQTHPEVRPSVVELEGAEALRELRSGAVDLLIAEEDSGSPDGPGRGLSTRHLADDEYRVVVPADWTPEPNAVQELVDRPWVTGPAESACGQALERIATRYRFTPRSAHTCLEYPAVLALVAAGFGAAILPTLALGDAATVSVRVPPVPVAGHRRLTAVRRTSRVGPEPVTEVLVDALQDAGTAAGLAPGAGQVFR